jgi:hypothetical protein
MVVSGEAFRVGGGPDRVLGHPTNASAPSSMV